MKVIYVAGPYRAKTEWELIENIRRSEKAAIKLWQEGWAVICPHKNTAHFGGLLNDESFLTGDLVILSRCDAIYMCKGWAESAGAREELALAKNLNKDIIYEENEA